MQKSKSRGISFAPTNLKTTNKQTPKIQSNPKSNDQYNIYSSEFQQSSEDIGTQKIQSSFQLESDPQPEQQDKQNLQKLMERLGLNKKKQTEHRNQSLEIVVNNFLENCIGTVDRKNNTEEYENLYNNAYQQKIKNTYKPYSSIYISELTQLEKLKKSNEIGLFSIILKIRILFRYISMTCQIIVQHALFQAFILIVILLNSIKMAVDDPLSTTVSQPQIEDTFTAIYVIQMVLKIFAFGFIFNKKAYLRDMWNIMDFLIVVTSLLPLVISLGFSVNALRAIRVLRPLRTITKVKALKMIVKTLFYSFSLVMDSLIILFFMMGVFAIAGMQLFSGQLKFVCMVQLTGYLSETLCNSDSDCQLGMICVKGITNPNFSVINFDTFLWSLLSVFQTITSQGWSNIMIYTQQTKGFIYLIYQILIIFVCLYILLNMTMAILKYKFAQVKQNAIQEQQQQKQQYQIQFLKKIGIFKDISALSKPTPLARIRDDKKKQIGCSNSLPPQLKKVNITTDQLIAYLDAPKSSQRIQKVEQEMINMKQLRQYGKYQDFKWNTNNLVFDKNQLQDKQINQKKDQEKEEQANNYQDNQVQQTELDSSLSEINSEQQESQMSSNEAEIDDRVYQMQQKLNPSTKHFQVKHLQNPTVSKTLSQTRPTQPEKKIKLTRQISEFDKLLQLIGSKPGAITQSKQIFTIPQIDINQIQPQTLYQRFADLGQYKIPRIQQKNELKKIQVVKKSIKKKDLKKQNTLVKQMVQQNALDLKQLHIKNQLQKTQLRFRIKNDQIINKQRQYDIRRVIISQKIKQIQKKKNQILENLNSLHFHVTYKPKDETIEKEQKIFTRNLSSNKLILKIPQIVQTLDQINKKQIQSNIEQIQQKQKNKQHYLKLLQNHLVQQKIQLKLERVTNTFFKRQTQTRSKNNNTEKSTPQEQYEHLREDDILKRHGHFELEFPFNLPESHDIISSINMKKQQYDIHIKGFIGLIKVLRKKLLLFVSHPFYDNFILIIVLMNTCLMSLSGYVQIDSPPYSYINQAFTYVFVADVVLKIVAYQIYFFGDIMNLFDLAVVGVSMIEVVLGSSSGTNLSALKSIRILRAFRVLRVTRLIRSLSYIKVVMGVINSIISQFMYVFFLMWLFIFIYTLLGMQIFGGTFVNQNISKIRQNYDTFFNALFTVFQVMTVQNWNDIETATCLSSVGPWGVVFLISWIFLGNWIMLNLLQAILLDGFDDDSMNPKQQVGESQTEQSSQLNNNEQIQQIQTLSKTQKQSEQQDNIETKHSIDFDSEDASFFIFDSNHFIRRICKRIVTSTLYQGFMLIIIIFSSLKLAFDTYITNTEITVLQQFSDISDFVFNILFIFEFLIKAIYLGFIIGQNAYLSTSWNKLDFFIVSVSIIDMSLTEVNLSIFKLMRTLRALRIITRNQQMKIMVSSLVQSLMGIFNVLIICMCVFLIFAILGMSLLQGKLNFCNVKGSQLIYNNYGPYNISQTQCINQGGVWTTQLINFENIGNGMISLYIFATKQNWPYYVFTFFDANETGPTLNNNQLLFFIFAVIFLFTVPYFFFDLLVGVMFMKYHEAQSKIKPKTLTDKQINWKNLQKIIVNQDPCFQLFIAPTNYFRSQLFKIISTSIFEAFISIVIIANIIIMAVADDDSTANTQYILSTLNNVCNYIFYMQLILKLATFGKAYFLSVWNVFDFIVVSASSLDIILQFIGSNNSELSTLAFLPQIARIFRVLRIARLLRNFKSFKGLQKLIETFAFSLPAIIKGLAILGLYLFICSILASYLFSNIDSDFSGFFDNYLNYHTFHNAFQTLFVNITGQNWYLFMLFSTTPGYATCLGGGTQCISGYYLVFWLPYIFLAQKVFQQLFVLIVLDQFEANYINQHNPLGIFTLLQENFRECWLTVTQKYHFQKIQTKKLVELVLLLKPPLGLAREQTLKKYRQQLQENDKISKEQIEIKVNELQQKMRKNAARLLHKMNILKNRVYFGYHETFYNFTRLSILQDCLQNVTDDQKEQLIQIEKVSEETLEKVKPAGSLYYNEDIQNQQDDNAPLNPISLILFTQMIIKSWHNYSVKTKNAALNRDKKKKNQKNNSLDNSCASDISEAKYEKMTNNTRNFGTRRGGLMQSKHKQGAKNCQFIPTPNMFAAYGQGKRTKYKVSIMKSINSRKSSCSKKLEKSNSKTLAIVTENQNTNPKIKD